MAFNIIRSVWKKKKKLLITILNSRVVLVMFFVRACVEICSYMMDKIKIKKLKSGHKDCRRTFFRRWGNVSSSADALKIEEHYLNIEEDLHFLEFYYIIIIYQQNLLRWMLAGLTLTRRHCISWRRRELSGK